MFVWFYEVIDMHLIMIDNNACPKVETYHYCRVSYILLTLLSVSNVLVRTSPSYALGLTYSSKQLFSLS